MSNGKQPVYEPQWAHKKLSREPVSEICLVSLRQCANQHWNLLLSSGKTFRHQEHWAKLEHGRQCDVQKKLGQLAILVQHQKPWKIPDIHMWILCSISMLVEAAVFQISTCICCGWFLCYSSMLGWGLLFLDCWNRTMPNGSQITTIIAPIADSNRHVYQSGGPKLSRAKPLMISWDMARPKWLAKRNNRLQMTAADAEACHQAIISYLPSQDALDSGEILKVGFCADWIIPRFGITLLHTHGLFQTSDGSSLQDLGPTALHCKIQVKTLCPISLWGMEHNTQKWTEWLIRFRLYICTS